jgi:hypothetical protein
MRASRTGAAEALIMHAFFELAEGPPYYRRTARLQRAANGRVIIRGGPKDASPIAHG